MKEKEYRVVWEIDVSAKSPKEAAKEALQVQRTNVVATVFKVRQHKTRKWETIDLK